MKSLAPDLRISDTVMPVSREAARREFHSSSVSLSGNLLLRLKFSGFGGRPISDLIVYTLKTEFNKNF